MTKQCKSCHLGKEKKEFAREQWKKGLKCKVCTQAARQDKINREACDKVAANIAQAHQEDEDLHGAELLQKAWCAQAVQSLSSEDRIVTSSETDSYSDGSFDSPSSNSNGTKININTELCPVETNVPRFVDIECASREDYVKECLVQLQAELYACFIKLLPTNASARGWRGRSGQEYRTEEDWVNRCKVISSASIRGDLVEDLRQFKGHWIIYRDNLYFVYKMVLSCGCQTDPDLGPKCPNPELGDNHKSAKQLPVISRRIMSMHEHPDKKWRDLPKPERENVMYDMGYVGEYYKGDAMLRVLLPHDLECPVFACECSVTSDGCTRECLECACTCRVKRRACSALLDILIDPCKAPLSAGHYRNMDEANVEFPSLQNTTACVDRDEARGEDEGSFVRSVKLVPSQQNIVDGLCKQVELIHGPPGTGKSTLTLTIVRDKLPRTRGNLVLILATQNKAVGVQVAMFAAHLNEAAREMVVIGDPKQEKLGVSGRKYTLDSLTDADEDVAAYTKLFEEFPSRYRNELKNARKRAESGILSDARIVLCTFGELFKVLTQKRFARLIARITSVIVDEASTVPEWKACLLSLLPSAKRLVFIGDVAQLPPFTHLGERAPQGWMERAQLTMKEEVPMLTVQFRMHKDISNLVSEKFYKGRLVTHEETQLDRATFNPEEGHHLRGVRYIDSSSSMFAHHFIEECDGSVRMEKGPPEKQHESTVGTSLANATEVHHAVEGILWLASRGVFDAGKTVAVISFYSAHTRRIKEALTRDERFKAHQQTLESGRLLIQTVDSSQGSEVDVVILCCVRSNGIGQVGFLSGNTGTKRACVAMSRARELLVIVGDFATLADVPSFANINCPEELFDVFG